MTLQIQCERCFARLQLPDEAAGHQSECPFCHHVQAAPQRMALRNILRFWDVFGSAWKIFWQHPATMVMIAVISLLPLMLLMRCGTLFGSMVAHSVVEAGNWRMPPEEVAPLITVGCICLFAMPGWLWTLWCGLGAARMMLHLSRSDETRWGLFLSPLPLFGNYILAMLLTSLIVVAVCFVLIAGTVLFVAICVGIGNCLLQNNDANPTVLFATGVTIGIGLAVAVIAALTWALARLSLWWTVIADNRCDGAWNAMVASWRMTRGYALKIVLIVLVVGLVEYFIDKATFHLAALAIVSFNVALTVAIYRTLLGEINNNQQHSLTDVNRL